MSSGENQDATELRDEIAALRNEVARLNAHRFVTLHNRPARLLAFNFARGLAFGLGSVLGATILVSAVVYLLSQVELVPIIGEWAKQIIDEVGRPQD